MTKLSWVFYGERSYLPFSISFSGCQTSAKYLKKYGDFRLADKFLYYKNGFYWPAGEIEEIAGYQVKQGTTFLWELAKKCESAGERFIKRLKGLVAEKISGTLVENLKAIIEEYLQFIVFMALPWALETFFADELQKILDKRALPADEKAELAKKLNQPLKFNDGQFEQISLLTIAGRLKTIEDAKKPEIKKMMQEHVKKYSWVPMRWLIGEPLSEEDVVLRLKELLKDNVQEKLRELNGQREKVRHETEEIAEKLTLTAQEKDFVLLLKEYVYIRTYRSDKIQQGNRIIMPRLEQAAKELGLSYYDVLYLSSEEVVQCLEKPALVKSIDIAGRKKSFLFYRDGEKAQVLEGVAAEKFADELGVKRQEHGDVKELRGTVGFKGIVQGPVKIVSNPKDCAKVQKGDILVAVMTFPSYIIAMERAAAFVTDEGGVLCHAAIVAREMKKPCVIATKIATAVLKDGDKVEVNADKGVVRKV
jgi:phosphoenolpyruvate synthase/pyruvate phosphate dikinase